MQEIMDKQQLLTLIEKNGNKNLFLFKHSTQCPISAQAFDAFKKFASKHSDVDCAYIDLLAFRDVSNLLSEKSNVNHQSPQVILYHQGKVLWTTSHRAITLAELETHF
jgi:bacillithiol system protein YtxJ